MRAAVASSCTERTHGKGRGRALLALVAAALLSASCTVDSAKSRYILAEKLYADQSYAAAVSEFEKVIARDPRGKLGLQALQRSALIQSLYLGQHADAVRKLRSFVELTPDPAQNWEAQTELGEILFARMEQYDQAVAQYRSLLKQRPDAPEAPEFLYRIARSEFFLWQFDEAAAAYQRLVKRFPGTAWAEKAAYEIGVTYFTQGAQQSDSTGNGAYQDAMDAYQHFVKRYPNSKLVPEAKFGIASCLEEMDQLDAAYHQYEALLDSYPSPNVIRIKMVRIRERKAQRSH
jgi:TolA-binding protein